MEAGTQGETRLEGGVIRYRDIGTGPALVFVRRTLADGTHWRDVAAQRFFDGGTGGPRGGCGKGCFREIDTDCNTLACTV